MMWFVTCLTLLILAPVAVSANVRKETTSSRKFVQTGVASWYGKKFQGKTTSNGEAYDMHAMTAAHNTLPHGVYVKVINKKNGREAVVRINDRGPVIRGRILDLSYSAAKTLGILECGLSPVKIEALGYADNTTNSTKGKTSYRPPKSYDTGIFGIQVGAYSKRENAEIMADSMRKRYGFASIQEAEVNGELFFRVRVGQYTSLRSAKQELQKICGKDVSGGFVVALEKH